MKSIEQIQQWADWASNNDAVEESILDMMHALLDEVKRLKLATVQLNEVAAKYQTKAEGAEQWAADCDTYKAALQWCHDNYPAIRDSDDVHFGGQTIADLVAEVER